MKALYVRIMHGLRALLRVTGLLALLDRSARSSPTARWVRSWFAIYDLDDLAGLGLPWWTFDAIDEVDAFLLARPGARVFEWGSGVSTLWLAAQGAQVTSVEHDLAWADRMRPRLGTATTLLTAPPAAVDPDRPGGPPAIRSSKSGFKDLDFREYVEAIDAVDGDFDLIVIDGRAREACLTRALGRLAPGGLVVFDDTERRRYAAAIAAIAEAGPALAVTWTRGRTPTVPYPCDTALITLARADAA